MKNIEIQIIELLRNELPSSILYKADEIRNLIEKGKYREAYLNMYELKNNETWSPTSEYIHLIEKFWWNIAN